VSRSAAIDPDGDGHVAGVDVGARELHAAKLDLDGVVLGTATLAADDPAGVARWLAGAAMVAIDAPEAPSTAPHADDSSLAPKFRTARCAEIELGRRHRSWVSWATPASPPFPGWMETGFGVFEELRSLGPELLEVYPHAGFRELAGRRRVARKQTASGRRERAGLLARAGIGGPDLAALSHHELDALMAAAIALERFRGSARRITCGHDGSAIWFPAAAG
jgi:predicted nuclease with RNAse H fold